MKKILNILVAGLCCIFTLGSCSDWFDISPKTDIKAEDLYQSENGFMSSLAGLYVLMTEENSYGADMTFALLDQLVQMYDFIPEGTNSNLSVYNYSQSTSGGYNTKGRLENAWLTSYNIIANANNLLKWLDRKGEEVILDDDTRNMIRGEALAIRAFIHFDLLRGWGPMNYAGNPDVRETKCIPYRIVADNSKQPLLPASKIVENIIKDLEQAKECLSFEKDTELGQGVNASLDRRYRFNYHAVNATLARVHNYAGNTSDAKTLALEVINDCGLDIQSSNDEDPILFNEVLCGVNMYQMTNFTSNYFASGDKIASKHYIEFQTIDIIFETNGSESDDMRARNSAFLRNSALQMAVTNKYAENDNEVIPLIRLPEMYYIVCECTEGDESAYYVNLIRNRRGISSANNLKCNTAEERLAALESEYRKEFYAEGQYFYFLKSHGVTEPLAHKPEVTMTEERFVFPLPDREKEYGWTEEDTNEEETEQPQN